ncbi:testis-expressed protein 2 [Ditylenchus destructor]|uniref:Testis-expressed protein 2 n=1 Tax=Ditylenchus destructor TaxID=166010 RepID=A0AAD4MIB8_9BILA|nr:testis-expressed protein 2 [Ditylenchus destructor]
MCCFKKRKSDKVPENPNIPSTKTTQNPSASMDVNEDVGGEKIYRGWVNLLNERYNPRTFHVNMLETVTVRLRGHMLHVEHHEKAVLRHAFYEDPTLTEREPEIIKEDVYDVSDAKV